MKKEMTFKEMNLRIFQGRDIPHVLFQPRIEPWYAWHKQFGLLPEKYQNLGLLDLFDELKLSMRYIHYYTDIPDPVEIRYSDKVKIIYNEENNLLDKIIQTPYGELMEKQKKTVDQTWRTIDFPVKTREDFKKLAWLYENTEYHFNPDKFETGARFMGDRGIPQFWVPKSPYQSLCQQWMKLDILIYALMDYPDQVHELMKLIDQSYDSLYQDIIRYGKVEIINFGENIHSHLFSPVYFEQYLIPFYIKRSGQLRHSGIYTHIHIDGYFKPILSYLKDLPFDGLEALTPLPQGDVSLEEINDNIGDKILLDGIPAVLFLPHHSRDELESCVKKIIDLFHPRLILGISDELPEGTDEESIGRVTWISDYCSGRFGKK